MYAADMASQQDSGFFEISIKYLLKSWSNGELEQIRFLLVCLLDAAEVGEIRSQLDTYVWFVS